MTDKTYMVTYTKNNKNFCCMLVEATDMELAEKKFKAFKPDCKFIDVREENHPETFIKRGMSIIDKNFIHMNFNKIDKTILADNVVPGCFNMIAKVKNQRELDVLKFYCGVEKDALLQETLPDFPFFIKLDLIDAIDAKYIVKSIETIDDIKNNGSNSDIVSFYKSSKNRVRNIEKLIYGENHYDFEDDILKLLQTEDNQQEVLNQLAYQIRNGNFKGYLHKNSNVRFNKNDIWNDKTILNAYEKMYPEKIYHFSLKYWNSKIDSEDGTCSCFNCDGLQTAIITAVAEIKENECVEVQAVNETGKEHTILYLGTDDISDSNSLGDMIIAEFQDIHKLKELGYLPEDY